jgi:threonyl-tRNA synthetase
MKLLVCHVAELSYSDVKRSNRPAELASDGDAPQVGEFADSVLAFVTVESDDDPDDASVMAREIERIVLDVGARPIVLMPFAHLSNRLAKPEVARSLLRAVRDHLVGKYDVTLVSFGYHKRLRLSIDIHGHAGSVAYRSSNGVASEAGESTTRP